MGHLNDCRSFAIHSRSDFPAPEGPMMLTNSPSLTSRSIPRSTSLTLDLSRKDFLIWRSRIMRIGSVVSCRVVGSAYCHFLYSAFRAPHSALESFISQRLHRIYSCRPWRRQSAGNQRHGAAARFARLRSAPERRWSQMEGTQFTERSLHPPIGLALRKCSFLDQRTSSSGGDLIWGATGHP